MLNCIALDDEPLALEILQTFCQETDFLNLQKVFTNPNDAAKYLRKFPVELLFLDIQMPDITGIAFLKLLLQQPLIIFTTAYTHYAVEGFNLNAIDYLLKPYSLDRFKQAANKANDYYSCIIKKDNASQNYLIVRAEYSLIKIDLTDIICIEGFDDYVKIHLSNRKPLLTRLNLKAIAEKLPASEFVRVHKSFIVPLTKIESIRNKVVHLPNIEIPIGANYEAEFNQKFSI